MCVGVCVRAACACVCVRGMTSVNSPYASSHEVPTKWVLVLQLEDDAIDDNNTLRWGCDDRLQTRSVGPHLRLAYHHPAQGDSWRERQRLGKPKTPHASPANGPGAANAPCTGNWMTGTDGANDDE